MRVLLDTHAVIWWVTDRGKVSPTVRALISDPTTEILVSTASTWEMAIKVASGKLPPVAPLIDDYDHNMTVLGWVSLAISAVHAIAAARLVGTHKDPFDRMLVAQSQVEGLVVATVDVQIANLGARVVW